MFSIYKHGKFLQKRLLSSVVEKTKQTIPVIAKVSKSKPLQEKEIEKFFDKNLDFQSIKSHIPNQLLHRTLNPTALYLVDRDVAKVIALAVRKKLTIKNTKNIEILEANPGLGLLTEELIKRGFRKLNLFEPRLHFFNYLSDKFSEKELNLTHADFFAIWKLAYQDRLDNGTRVDDMLKNFTHTPWTPGSSGMKIIGTIPNLNFIRHVMFSIILQSYLVTYGRPEMIIVMYPSTYHVLTAQPDSGYLNYRSISVMFQMLFNIEIVEKLPRNSYLPWQPSRSKSRRNMRIKQLDVDHLYLVHISGKKDLPVPSNQLQPLWYFIRHHMISRTTRIIPQMERWIPGSGSQFILASTRSKDKRNEFKNVGIFTTFGEVCPAQLLEIFRQFVAMPEYKESPFLASMETSLMKLETTEDCTNVVSDETHPHEQELLEDHLEEEIDDKPR